MSLQTDTALDILIDAFDDIVVHMDEETLGASDERTGIRAINRIMAMLESNGVDLGFTKLTKINDPITIPEGASDALITLLALRLWPKYRKGEPSNALIASARKGLTQMYKLGITVSETAFPGTLPIGSGTVGEGYSSSAFYPGLEDSTDD